MSRKPCILVILIPLANLVFLTMPNVSGFVPYRLGRISRAVRCTARRSMPEQSGWEFDVEEVLQSAHDVWGRKFEVFVAEKMGKRYEKVIGPGWSINFGKAGQVDFLGIGSGKDAWEAFAKDYKTDMRNSTWTKLQAPHFLIAEIGLTSKTLMKKFQENRTSITLMKDFVSRLDANNISAVKCLVYDGADGGRLTDSDAASKFLNESGILINVPYMSAETVLNKFNKVEKLEETLSKLFPKLFSGVTICHV